MHQQWAMNGDILICKMLWSCRLGCWLCTTAMNRRLWVESAASPPPPVNSPLLLWPPKPPWGTEQGGGGGGGAIWLGEQPRGEEKAPRRRHWSIQGWGGPALNNLISWPTDQIIWWCSSIWTSKWERGWGKMTLKNKYFKRAPTHHIILAKDTNLLLSNIKRFGSFSKNQRFASFSKTQQNELANLHL